MAEVRQRGFMVGIELGGFAPELRMGHQVTVAARELGAIIRPLGDVVVLMPPLAISEADLRRLVTITAQAIARCTAAPPSVAPRSQPPPDRRASRRARPERPPGSGAGGVAHNSPGATNSCHTLRITSVAPRRLVAPASASFALTRASFALTRALRLTRRRATRALDAWPARRAARRQGPSAPRSRTRRFRRHLSGARRGRRPRAVRTGDGG